VKRRAIARTIMAGTTAMVLPIKMSRAASSDTINFGYLYPNLTTLMHGVAISIGAYQKQNLNVAEQRFSSGQTVEGVQALWQGELDLYYGGGPEVASLNSRAIESGRTAPLAVVSAGNAGFTYFVLRPDLKPAKFDDLVGKPLRIAVSSPSSDHLALFLGWLRIEKKMTADQLGWQFLTVEGPDMPTALLTNQIDGFLHSEPTTTICLRDNAGYIYMEAERGDFGASPPPLTFLAGNRDFIAKRPELVKRFLTALEDANAYYAKADQAALVPIISKWSGIAPTVVSQAFTRIHPRVGMSPDQAQKWWNYLGVAMIAKGQLTKSFVPASDLFDLQYQPQSMMS
jgi:ABC-type nitrate/sulfonate/bicarbonate transport system substrate-binding protein